MSSTALAAGNVDEALSLANRSVSIEPMPENLRLVTSVDAAKISQLSHATSSSAGQQATDLLKSAVATAQRAVALDPQDYLSYMTIGQLYELMVPLKVSGAYDSAHTAYAKAAELSPLNPSIPLLMARLESEGGTEQGLADALKKSLTLKPDYTDAILFLAQVDIARQDLPSAIHDTQVAAQTAPGVPSIWLQLGLLYYAGGDSKNAIAPLEQALKVQPDYANAQYFLGLAYDAQGRSQDALALFNRLNQTNPGNAQIQMIMANIQGGRPALSTSTPETTR
jgi:tetratricopeptide (TPR) repeat protein